VRQHELQADRRNDGMSNEQRWMAWVIRAGSPEACQGRLHGLHPFVAFHLLRDNLSLSDLLDV
jgi:hypothetical protein